MSADNEIYIKLEISRDKTTGELAIIIRLKNSAPNIFIENENVEWFPTIMEKNLINDTFELFSNTKKISKTSNLNDIRSGSDTDNENGSDDNSILPKKTSSDEKLIIDKVLIQKKEQI